jgi:Bacterial Ig domain
MRLSLFILMVLVVMSCDVSKEDYLQNPVTKEENLTNTFYTLPESNLTIDPTAFEQLKLANSLVVSQVPVNGEAKFIENGFVFYRSTNPQAVNDAFVIGGKTATGAIVNEEVKINYVNNQADLPCFAGTIGDKAKTEIEKSTEINVLTNDKTCSSIENNSLTIEIQPKNGKAEVINQKIVYTPNKDFMGEDVFFYRVGINTKKNPVAPVELTISESGDCINGMTDDIINVLTYTIGSNLILDVLQNDKICTIYQKAELKVIKNPTVGTLRIDKNNLGNLVVFYKSDTTPRGIQTFEYGLYRSEKLYIKAKVSVNFN